LNTILTQLVSLEENWVFVTNQFATSCEYLTFTTIVGYLIYKGNSVCLSVWAVPGKFWTWQQKEKNVTSSSCPWQQKNGRF
jgi:hypothetical protein